MAQLEHRDSDSSDSRLRDEGSPQHDANYYDYHDPWKRKSAFDDEPLQPDRGIYHDLTRLSSSRPSFTPIFVEDEDISLEKLNDIIPYSTKKAHASPEPHKCRPCAGCRRRKIKCDSQFTYVWPCANCTRLKVQCLPPPQKTPSLKHQPRAYASRPTPLTASQSRYIEAIKACGNSQVAVSSEHPTWRKSSAPDAVLFPCAFSLLPCDYSDTDCSQALYHSLGHLYSNDVRVSFQREFPFAHSCPLCSHEFAGSLTALLFKEFIEHVVRMHESFFLDVRIGPKMYKQFFKAGVIGQYQYDIIESICVWESKRRPLHEAPGSTSMIKRSIPEHENMTQTTEEAGAAATLTRSSSDDEEEGQECLHKDPHTALDDKLDVSARGMSSPTYAAQEKADPATIAPVIISEIGSTSGNIVESDNFAEPTALHTIEDQIPAHKDGNVGSSPVEQPPTIHSSIGATFARTIQKGIEVLQEICMSRVSLGYSTYMRFRDTNSHLIEWDCVSIASTTLIPTTNIE